MTHSSAAYSPTITQTSQQKLLFLIASKLRTAGIFSSYYTRLGQTTGQSLSKLSGNLDVAYYNNSNSSLNITRKLNLQLNKRNWENRLKRVRINRPTPTNIFKRPREKNIKHA